MYANNSVGAAQMGDALRELLGRIERVQDGRLMSSCIDAEASSNLICGALRTFRHHSRIYQQAFLAMHMLANTGHASHFVAAGACELACQYLRDPEADVRVLACWASSLLGVEDVGGKQLVERGAVPLICTMMRDDLRQRGTLTPSPAEDALTPGCSALKILSQVGDGLLQLHRAGGGDLVIAAMKADPQAVSVHNDACQIIALLCTVDEGSIIDHLSGREAVVQVCNALEKFGHFHDVQDTAALALIRLSFCEGLVPVVIEAGVCELLAGVVAAHYGVTDVGGMSAICLGRLACDADGLRRIVATRVCDMVNSALKVLIVPPNHAYYGLELFCAVVDDPAGLHQLLNAGVLMTAIEVMGVYAGVVIEGCGAVDVPGRRLVSKLRIGLARLRQGWTGKSREEKEGDGCGGGAGGVCEADRGSHGPRHASYHSTSGACDAVEPSCAETSPFGYRGGGHHRGLEIEGHPQACTAVCRMMRDSPSSEAVQVKGLVAMRLLVESKGRSSELMAIGAYDVVIAALTNFPQSESVQFKGLTVMRWLAKDDGIGRALVDRGACELVMSAMKTHPVAAAELHCAGYALLARFCRFEVGRERVVQSGGCQAICTALHSYAYSQAVEESVMNVIRHLVKDDDACAELVEHDAIEGVCGAMKAWPEAKCLQAYGCSVLAALAIKGGYGTQRLMSAGGHVLVVKALKRLAHSDLVQLSGCTAVSVLAMAGASVDVLVQLGVCEALGGALTTHPDHAQVQVSALRALTCFTSTPEGRRRVKALPCQLVCGNLGRLARDREHATEVLTFLMAFVHAGTTDLPYLVEGKAVDAVRIAASRWADDSRIQDMAALLILAFTPYCTDAHQHSRGAFKRMVNIGVSLDTADCQKAFDGSNVEGRSGDADVRPGGVVDDGSESQSGGGGRVVDHSLSSRSQARRRRRKKGAGKATTAAGGDSGAVAAADDDDDMDSAVQSHEASTGPLSCGAAGGAGYGSRVGADGSSVKVKPQPYNCDAGSKGVSVDRSVVEHERTTHAAASGGGGRTNDDVGGAKGGKVSSSPESWLLGRVGETLLCPISLEVMVDPVVAADGITYCRQALQQHIDYARQNELELRSPTTGLPMQAGFHDNVLVRSLAQEYMEAQRQKNTTA